MSERCFCFFSVKDSGGSSEHSVSRGPCQKPLSLDIYPGETGRPSKVMFHLPSTWENVCSALPCSVCSEHRDQNSKRLNQTHGIKQQSPGLSVAVILHISLICPTFPLFLILTRISCSLTCFSMILPKLYIECTSHLINLYY